LFDDWDLGFGIFTDGDGLKPLIILQRCSEENIPLLPCVFTVTEVNFRRFLTKTDTDKH